MLVLHHAIPPDGFCSSLLRRPHLPHGSRPLRSLFNLCGGPTSLDDIQQPFPRCRLSATRSLCRLRRQRSLRGRFAPIRRSISILKPKTQTFQPFVVSVPEQMISLFLYLFSGHMDLSIPYRYAPYTIRRFPILSCSYRCP